jgi:hypothetical protein
MYGHITVFPGDARNPYKLYSIEKFIAFQLLSASKIARCIWHLDVIRCVAM